MADQFGFVEVAKGVFAFVPEPDGEYGGTNGGFIVADDGVLAIEGYLTRKIAGRVIDEIKRVTQKPIRFLVYTHFHGDHIYAGEMYLPAAVVAHRAARQEIIEKWEPSLKRYSNNRPPEIQEEFKKMKPAMPEVCFSERLTLDLGSHQLELIHLGEAHSRGDIFIHLPKERVVFAGDAVLNSRIPYCADGYVGSWIDVLDRAEAIDADIVVPGHGPIGEKKIVGEMRTYLDEARAQIRASYEAGKSVDEAIEALDISKYAHWTAQNNKGQAVRRLYLEWQGVL